MLLGFIACGSSSLEAKTKNSSSSDFGNCLPSDTKLDDVVSRESQKAKVTVEQKLKELGATCKANKLVAKNGKPIYFYRLTGCWGMAPQNYQEILAEQRRKITELEKTHAVIQMTCNPSGAEIQ